MTIINVIKTAAGAAVAGLTFGLIAGVDFAILNPLISWKTILLLVLLLTLMIAAGGLIAAVFRMVATAALRRKTEEKNAGVFAAASSVLGLTAGAAALYVFLVLMNYVLPGTRRELPLLSTYAVSCLVFAALAARAVLSPSFARGGRPAPAFAAAAAVIVAAVIYGNHADYPRMYMLPKRTVLETTRIERLVKPRLEPPLSKVVVLGLDAVDWRVVDSLIERGKLPNFKRLIETGWRADLQTYYPTVSAMLWTTIVTGKHPEKTGVLGIISTHLPGTGWLPGGLNVPKFFIVHWIESFLVNRGVVKQLPLTSNQTRVKQVWKIADGLGIHTGVLAWWVTWPADTLANGFIVSDRMNEIRLAETRGENLADRMLVSPKSAFNEIMATVVQPDNVPPSHIERFMDCSIGEARGLGGGDALGYLTDRAAVDLTALDQAKHFVSSPERPDLLLIFFKGLDSVQHTTWNLSPQAKGVYVTPPPYKKCFENYIEGYYEFYDDILGELVTDTANTTYIIASDHGFERDERQHEEAPPGILLIVGKHAAAGKKAPAARMVDITPTILYLLGAPAAEDMDGSPILEALDARVVAERQQRKVPAYETKEPPRAFQPPIPSKLDREYLKYLKNLGYIK